MPDPATDPLTYSQGEAKLAAALQPFGWTCTREFWQRYYTDPWVFNLANAVERLTDQVAEGSGWRTDDRPLKPGKIVDG